MQYLMIFCHDDAFTPPQTLFADIGVLNEAMQARSIRVYGNPLRPASDGTNDVASRHPTAKVATNEVRPIWNELAGGMNVRPCCVAR